MEQKQTKDQLSCIASVRLNIAAKGAKATFSADPKYLQQEVVHERQFDNVRDISTVEQQRMGRVMIEEMSKIVENHQRKILGI